MQKASVIYGIRKMATTKYFYIGKTSVNVKNKNIKGEMFWKIAAERRCKRHLRESFSKTHFNKDLEKFLTTNFIVVDVLYIVKKSIFQSESDYINEVHLHEQEMILKHSNKKFNNLANKVLPTKKFIKINKENIDKYINNGD